MESTPTSHRTRRGRKMFNKSTSTPVQTFANETKVATTHNIIIGNIE